MVFKGVGSYPYPSQPTTKRMITCRPILISRTTDRNQPALQRDPSAAGFRHIRRHNILRECTYLIEMFPFNTSFATNRGTIPMVPRDGVSSYLPTSVIQDGRNPVSTGPKTSNHQPAAPKVTERRSGRTSALRLIDEVLGRCLRAGDPTPHRPALPGHPLTFHPSPLSPPRELVPASPRADCEHQRPLSAIWSGQSLS